MILSCGIISWIGGGVIGVGIGLFLALLLLRAMQNS